MTPGASSTPDLRDPQKILPQAAQTLDFSRPVAVMLIAITHLIGDQDDPDGIIGQLMAAVPAGSYLALSQVASDIEAEQMAEAARRYNRLARETQSHRSHAEVMRFFDGLELLEPGLVPVQQWRPASEIEAGAHSAMWGGVARLARPRLPRSSRCQHPTPVGGPAVRQPCGRPDREPG